MGKSAKRLMGKILVDGGFMQRHDLDFALEEQKLTKELLGQALVRMGMLNARDVTVLLNVQGHLDTIDNAVKIAAGERQLLGDLLVLSGHITREQLDQVLAEQRRSGEKFGEIVTRLGMLTKRQLTALLDFQLNQESANDSPLRLGELLVATGHITRDHLNDALLQQTQSSGKNLGEVLVEAGYVRPDGLTYGVRLQKMLLKAVLSTIIALGTGTGPMPELAQAETGETCLFSKQLQSSPMREQYIAKVATESRTMVAYNTATDSQVQSDATDDLTYPSIFSGKSRTTYNQGDTIDPFSRECLGCHDGGAAHNIDVNFKNAPGIKAKNYDGTKQHPIGMNYSAYAAIDSHNYKSVAAFDTKMIFVNGRVGCLTCHNPLNPEKDHLVMSDYRSALCGTCHTK